MKKITLLSIILVILSIMIPGCLEEVEPTPTPTPTPTATPMVTTPVPTPTTPVPTPTPERESLVTYIVWVDSDYGFNRIRALRDSTYIELSPGFNVLNFTIRVGDRVRWINDDTLDYPITIISSEGLWTNRTAYLRWETARHEYTFNETGTYTFYLREYRRLKSQQITVIP